MPPITGRAGGVKPGSRVLEMMYGRALDGRGRGPSAENDDEGTGMSAGARLRGVDGAAR